MITKRVHAPNASGGILRGMSLWFRAAVSMLALGALPGCYAHQRAHSVVRIWADHNTYNQCSLCMEELDHKPLRAARVGAFIWMYDQDPGHQNAYAKARRDWEALVAARLDEATEAVNKPGVGISGGSAPAGDCSKGTAVEAAQPAVAPVAPLNEDLLPPLPEHTAQRAATAPVASLHNAETLPTENERATATPVLGERQSPASIINSPRRVQSNLPSEPPGISTDLPQQSMDSNYRLSGYQLETRPSAASQSAEKTYRRPQGAWLFSRP